MTSSDDDYGQRSNTNPRTGGTYHRRINNDSNPSNTGIELRLLVTFRDAGAIIGKSGASIQKLRSDHPRTMIQVPQCASPERVLIINGEEEQCYDVLRQIIPLLIDSSRFSAFNRRRTSPQPSSNNDNDNNHHAEGQTSSNSDPSAPCEVRLLIPQIYCGAIIGKGGQHVKELRQTYQLEIKVFSQCCPLSHERIICLRGKIDDIIECIKNIYQLMENSSQSIRVSQLIKYDPHNFDVYLVNEYGGFPSSNGMENRTTYNPRGPYLAAPGPARGGTRYATPSILTSTRVTLPNELVGAIIGPRGAKIQEIRQVTQANIIIDDQAIPSGNGGSGDRIITIEGTAEQITRAQALLQQAVRQSGLWRP